MAKNVRHIAKNDSALPDDSLFSVNPDLKPLSLSHPIIEQKREGFKPFASNKVDESNMGMDWTLINDSERKELGGTEAIMLAHRQVRQELKKRQRKQQSEPVVRPWIKVAILVHGVLLPIIDSLFNLLDFHKYDKKR